MLLLSYDANTAKSQSEADFKQQQVAINEERHSRMH